MTAKKKSSNQKAKSRLKSMVQDIPKPSDTEPVRTSEAPTSEAPVSAGPPDMPKPAEFMSPPTSASTPELSQVEAPVLSEDGLEATEQAGEVWLPQQVVRQASTSSDSVGEGGSFAAVPAVALSLEQWREIEAHLVQLHDAVRTSDWGRSAALGQTLLQRFRTMGDQQTIQVGEEPPVGRAIGQDVLPELHQFDEFGACPQTQRRARPVLDFLARRYFRIRCYGMENIPATEPVILVANHSGVLPYDALMLRHMISEKSTLGRSVRPLVEDLFYHAPFVGPMLYRLGCVRANRDNARRLLAKGEAVVVFPEGYKGLGKLYSQRYRLRRFGRGGFIRLALETGAPLLPVAIVGAEELHPVLGKLNLAARALGVPFFPITPTFPLLGPLGLIPFPSPWSIRFGAPIHLPHTAKDAHNPVLINRLVEEFRQKLQNMVDLLVEERTP